MKDLLSFLALKLDLKEGGNLKSVLTWKRPA